MEIKTGRKIHKVCDEPDNSYIGNNNLNNDVLWVNRDDLLIFINGELQYESTQNSQRNKGYFDAMKTIKNKLTYTKEEDDK